MWLTWVLTIAIEPWLHLNKLSRSISNSVDLDLDQRRGEHRLSQESLSVASSATRVDIIISENENGVTADSCDECLTCRDATSNLPCDMHDVMMGKLE